jgi:hypothetical protein
MALVLYRVHIYTECSENTRYRVMVPSVSIVPSVIRICTEPSCAECIVPSVALGIIGAECLLYCTEYF